MATYWGPADASGSQLKVDITWTQNIAGNYSVVRVVLSYVGQWAASDNSTVGVAVNGSQAYWYQGSLSLGTGTNVLSDTYTTVYHNANGTGSVTVAGSLYMPFAGKNLGVQVNTLTLPTIPRQPAAPTKPWISAFGTTTLTVEFRHQGSIGATSFQLQRATNSSFTSGLVTTNTGTSGTIPVSGLTPGTTYYFRARAQNASGWSPWSPVLTTYTLPSAQTPTVDSITATGMRVRFSANGGGAGGTTWTIQRATNSAFTQNVVNVTSGATTIFSDLTPGTTYYFRVRGKNASGTGPWSGAASGTTLGIDAPTLSVASGDTGANATATIGAPSGATISNYTLEAEYLAPLPKPAGADKSVTTTSVTPTVDGLIPGATYRWRVRANVGSYSTAWSGWVTVVQVNPNQLDEVYFDGSFTSTDPDIGYMTIFLSGIGVGTEQALRPLHWTPGDNSKITLRRGPDSLVPSVGSTHAARVKVVRPLVGALDTATVTLAGPAASKDKIPVLPAATHSAKVSIRATAPIPVTIGVYWYSNVGTSGTFIRSDFGEAVALTAGETRELTLLAKSPENAAFAEVVVLFTDAPWGTLVDLDGGFLALGRPESYFDGDTPDTYRFTHEWAGARWNSVSLRTIDSSALEPDPFADPNCPAPPAPPRPPIPENECVPEVTTWRRYFSPLEAEDVSAAFDSLPTFTITTGGRADGPIRVQIFENPGNVPVADFVPSVPVSEQVITYLPANSEAVLDAVSERAYGRRLDSTTYSDIDHLVFGAMGGPATWPVVGCNQSYMIVVDVPSTSPIGNVKLSAELTSRMG